MRKLFVAGALLALTGCKCGTPPPKCVPKTCADKSLDCGQTDDGCGTSFDCGSCSAGKSCDANVCKCAPESDAVFCSRLGDDCGAVTAADNCGTSRTVVSCGSCPTPKACIANVCSCTPQSDADFCTTLS